MRELGGATLAKRVAPPRFGGFFVPLVPLPDPASLLALYERIRRRHFVDPNGQALLPPPQAVTIQWSTRLSASAGVCYPARRVIRLSVPYHERYPDQIEATLTHEMIHLLVPGHGPAFYAWLTRIQAQGGAVDRYARSRATPRQPPRWRYCCLRCGHIYWRQRRLPQQGRRHRCGRCHGMLQEAPA